MGSKRGKRPMPIKHKCEVCGRGCAMDWAKSNHEKLCKEKK